MYAIEKKLEERYDKEEEIGTPQACIKWVNDVLAGEQGFDACNLPNNGETGSSWQTVVDFLKDGSVLCRLINKLREAEGKGKVSFKAKAKFAAQTMANIETFNKACEEYGVPTTATFQTTDLVDGRKGPMVNVINCLNQLGFTANSKNFTPCYVPPESPKADF